MDQEETGVGPGPDIVDLDQEVHISLEGAVAADLSLEGVGVEVETKAVVRDHDWLPEVDQSQEEAEAFLDPEGTLIDLQTKELGADPENG